jgi:hypothetical protein
VKEARAATKTANMIVAYLREAGKPQKPASVAAALPISRERAKKAMQRMAKNGTLLRTREGYTIRAWWGHFVYHYSPIARSKALTAPRGQGITDVFDTEVTRWLERKGVMLKPTGVHAVINMVAERAYNRAMDDFQRAPNNREPVRGSGSDPPQICLAPNAFGGHRKTNER